MFYEETENEIPENEVTINKEIGKQLMALRKKKGLSQDKLADKLYVDRRTIINYEKGRTMIPAHFLYRCAIIFNVPADCFLFGNDSRVISKDLVINFINDN